MGTPLGDRLRERRNELGMTQIGVAEKMNVTQSYYHKIEDGEIKRPSGPRLRAIADALGLTFDELSMLAGLADRPSTAAWFRSQLVDADAARLDDMHSQIDPVLMRLDGEEFQALLRHAEMLGEMAQTRRSLGKLGPVLSGLTPERFESLMQAIELWTEGADIRQDRAAARNGTGHGSPSAPTGKTPPQSPAPEASDAACGR